MKIHLSKILNEGGDFYDKGKKNSTEFLRLLEKFFSPIYLEIRDAMIRKAAFCYREIEITGGPENDFLILKVEERNNFLSLSINPKFTEYTRISDEVIYYPDRRHDDYYVATTKENLDRFSSLRFD